MARCCLAEDFGQPHERELLGGDEVAQDHAGSDAGQLIDISHNEHLGLTRDGFDKGMSQEQVEHRGFIDDKSLCLQGVVFVVAKLHGLRIESQQPMNGFGFLPGHLCKTLGRSSRWSCQQNRFAHRFP